MNRRFVVSIACVALGAVAVVGAQQTGAGSSAEVHVLPIRGNISMLIAPVCASLLFPKGAKEWRNPVMRFLTERYRAAVRIAIERRWLTIGFATLAVAGSVALATSGKGEA